MQVRHWIKFRELVLSIKLNGQRRFSWKFRVHVELSRVLLLFLERKLAWRSWNIFMANDNAKAEVLAPYTVDPAVMRFFDDAV